MAKKSANGKSRGRRKLSDTQVLEIAKTYSGRGGVTMKMLAEKFSVSIGTISAIMSGRTYSWLTGIMLGGGEMAAAA